MTSVRVTTRRYSFQVVREAEPAYPAGITLERPHNAVASSSSSTPATASPASSRSPAAP
jgi:hypothetical protein